MKIEDGGDGFLGFYHSGTKELLFAEDGKWKWTKAFILHEEKYYREGAERVDEKGNRLKVAGGKWQPIDNKEGDTKQDAAGKQLVYGKTGEGGGDLGWVLDKRHPSNVAEDLLGGSARAAADKRKADAELEAAAEKKRAAEEAE